MFPVLEHEIKARRIKKKEISKLLGVQPRTFSKKLNGEILFSLDEAIKIHENWFENIPIEKLFQKKNLNGGMNEYE
ncbi:MAG: hypothetical protein K2O52_05940 [Oscillospiraceae bacterium]|nr:hypothetical protein [Oscillospiraceae bacterium]